MFFSAICFSGQASAYEGEHYAWTYYLALHVGFTERQAYQLASATYAIDWDADTGPMEAGSTEMLWGGDYARALSPREKNLIRSAWNSLSKGRINTRNYNSLLKKIGDHPDYLSSGDPVIWFTDDNGSKLWWASLGIETPKDLTADTRIRNVWSKFHAFAEAELVPGKATTQKALRTDKGDLCLIAEYRKHPVCKEEILTTKPVAYTPSNEEIALVDLVQQHRQQRKEELWKLGVDEGNIGPYLHYMQDYYAHNDYTNIRGHALNGHNPDFYAYAPNRARSMTRETVKDLSRFLEQIGGKPKTVNWERIWQTFDALVEVNKPTYTAMQVLSGGVAGATGPMDSDQKGLWAFTKRKLLTDKTGPDLSKSLKVIHKAIETDKHAGYLPAFIETVAVNNSLPEEWVQYDYDGQGRVIWNAQRIDGAIGSTSQAISVEKTADLYSVERARLILDDPLVTFSKSNKHKNKYAINVSLSYTLSGLSQIPFIPKLPVVEQCGYSHIYSGDWAGRKLKALYNGTFEIDSSEVYRSSNELKGTSWKCAIYAYGLEPVTKVIQIKPPRLSITKGHLVSGKTE